MMRLAPSHVSDQLQSRQAWCLWPQRPLCSECAPLAVSQARAVPCNSSLSQFPNSFCRLFRCSFVSPLLPCLLSHSALLSLQHNPLSDKACWLRTHSYLQEQPRGAVVEKERVMLIHTFTPGSCPAPCCLTLGSFIWGGGIAMLKGTWANFEEFLGHFLLPLLQSFPWTGSPLPLTILSVAFTFSSPSPLLSLAVTRQEWVRARILNMSERRLVTLTLRLWKVFSPPLPPFPLPL